MNSRLPPTAKTTTTVSLVALLMVSLIGPGSAHIVREDPWHPVPAAYLRSLFFLNLKPVPWDLIAAEFQSPLPAAGYEGRSVLDLLSPVALGGNPIDHRIAINSALESHDQSALYRSSTIALSQLVRHHLAVAEAALEEPGAASQPIARAEAICRAFYEDAIEAADPDGYESLGRAWLELSTSVGTKGVFGIGAKPADRDRFAAARTSIDEYLERNYEGAIVLDASSTWIAPVPAHAPDPEAALLRFSRRLPPGTKLNDQNPLPTLRLNFEARGIDESELFLVAYGDMLFDSPAIFGEPATTVAVSCATCHNRSDINRDLFIPGISHQAGAVDVDGQFFNPRFNDRVTDPIDIPSLRGLRFTAPYGRNGRFASLRDFTRNVIVNEFGGAEPTPFMLDALVAYMFEFDWLSAPILRADGTLDANLASPSAQRGEAIFSTPFEGMGDRSCATCHIPSANFIDRKPHDIGSAPPTEPGARDTFFDTPTLLNAVHTAPYFHDGSLPTLRAVVEWFDENHDLALSAKQIADLTAYLEAAGSGEEPYELFDESHTPFGLAWDELSTFLTTLDTLLPARDRQHALLLLDTVAPDLRADVVGAWEPSAVASQAYEIADTLDQLRSAIEVEQWTLAETIHRRYQELADEYGPQFH